MPTEKEFEFKILRKWLISIELLWALNICISVIIVICECGSCRYWSFLGIKQFVNWKFKKFKFRLGFEEMINKLLWALNICINVIIVICERGSYIYWSFVCNTINPCQLKIKEFKFKVLRKCIISAWVCYRHWIFV